MWWTCLPVPPRISDLARIQASWLMMTQAFQLRYVPECWYTNYNVKTSFNIWRRLLITRQQNNGQVERPWSCNTNYAAKSSTKLWAIEKDHDIRAGSSHKFHLNFDIIWAPLSSPEVYEVLLAIATEASLEGKRLETAGHPTHVADYRGTCGLGV